MGKVTLTHFCFVLIILSNEKNVWSQEHGLNKKAIYPYLNHTNAEEVKVCNSTELFKQILWDKIQYCVLKKKNSLGSTIHLITKTTEENTKKKHPYYCYLSLEKRPSSKFIWLVSRSFIRPI